MDLFAHLLIGALVGTHMATWGMYKDSIHEGFTWSTYLRSIVVATTLGAGVYAFGSAGYFTPFDMSQAYNWAILFGLLYVLERGVVEFYKVFLRDEDQSKYFIPMQFHINGRVIKNRGVRSVIAVVYAGAVLGILYAIYAFSKMNHGMSGLLVVLTIGSIGGWVSAFGGAWKDAPIEGFETFKFFRSPAIALTWAFALSLLTTNYLLIALPALGYTVASIETYKTFFFPSRPRGKFAGKPILYPEMLEKRKRFVPAYVAIWIFVITSWVLALTRPHSGLINLG
jgi:hypothetical protein